MATDHPLDLSTRILDTGDTSLPTNRITEELSELAPGVHLIESFSHAVIVTTDDGLVVFDTSGAGSGSKVVGALRAWSDERVHSIVYTHGHVDHVGGSRSFAADADERGVERPTVIAHEAVGARFERYQTTNGYNQVINARQFGGAPRATGNRVKAPFLPDGTLWPTVAYADQLITSVGGTEFEFRHCIGETDDHTWTYVPEHRMIAAGDQFIWNFPNCGNPQKVQRYALEWAESLRAMAATDVELFVPAHGLPIIGHERIVRCLDTVATTLEQLVADVLDAMNAGAALDEIVHSVHVDPATLELPYLRPLYDEPEFVIRNIWRRYGGWWDGNPARLKPPSDAAVGSELATLIGVDRLIERAKELSAIGDHRLACQLIEYGAAAEPEHRVVNEERVAIYAARRRDERSLMAKGIYASAEADSQLRLDGDVPPLALKLDIGLDAPADRDDS